MNALSAHQAPSPNFAPTKDTLWAVWGTSPDDQVASGWSESIYQLWVLASPDDEGLAQIQKSGRDEFLAAAPFKDVAKAHELALLAAGKGVESRMPAWLKPARDSSVLLCRNPDQTLSWTFGEAAGPGHEVLTEGKISDLAALVAEGEAILRDRLYQKITSDRRPVEPGHPLGWLLMMRSPDAWREDMEKEGVIRE